MFEKIHNFIFAPTSPDFQKKYFYLQGLDFKKNILERRGFRGGSDEKIRRMWLGLNVVVVGFPPLVAS